MSVSSPISLENDDRDLLAIQSMLQESAEIRTDRAQFPSKNAQALPELPEQPAEQVAPPDSSQRPSRVRRGADQIFRWGVERVKTYRPERKRILLTSLVLLLLLKPFFVIGWTTVAIIALGMCFLFLGGDQFWRSIIEMHRRLAARKPDVARKIKLRAYVIARKWERVLRFMPNGLADQLRPPDLREIIAADARHEAAVTQRLNRLEEG